MMASIGQVSIKLDQFSGQFNSNEVHVQSLGASELEEVEQRCLIKAVDSF